MRKFFSIIRLCLYIIVIIIAYLIPLSFIETRSFCIFNNLFNIKCIGCGVTRGLFNILHFNLRQAFNYNHFSLIWFSLFVLLLSNDIIIIIKLLSVKTNVSLSIIEKLFFNLINSFNYKKYYQE